jgi:hypothetical protein
MMLASQDKTAKRQASMAFPIASGGGFGYVAARYDGIHDLK